MAGGPTGTKFAIGVEYRQDLLTMTGHRQLVRDLYRDELRHHLLVMLPKHFSDSSENRVGGGYDISPRTVRWQKRKQKEGRPATANVYRGDLRSSVLNKSRITATSNGGTLYAKQLYKLRPAQRKQRNAEIERITPAEKQHHLWRMRKNYVALATSKTAGYRRTRQRRSQSVSP